MNAILRMPSLPVSSLQARRLGQVARAWACVLGLTLLLPALAQAQGLAQAPAQEIGRAHV